MTATDWIIDAALILIVFRQLREQRLTARTVLLPVALMSWAGFTYLHSLPTAGNDLVLIGALAGIGVVFGLFGGLLTRVRFRDGNVYLKATVSAAALWVISMGFRMAFAVWSSYGSGVSHIASFSVAHDITSGQAWVAALILMAFGEVIVRTGIIVIRGQRLTARGGQRSAGQSSVGRSAEKVPVHF
jgi:membrane protein CcdC involved in cytochrome C biogenesis